jgi:tetratricopeptide (TPR) repeat protein
LVPLFELIRGHQTGPARVRLNNYLQLHPGDVQAKFLFGLSYHREQRYMQAMPYYDEAVAVDPSFSLTHHFRGWALYYMGELDAAKESFERFLVMMPNEPDSLFALGLIALDEDELVQAEDYLQRSLNVLKSQGDSGGGDRKALSKAHTRLGEVYERTDRLEEARQQMTRAVELFPDHYESMYKLSRVLARLGRTEEAQQAYDAYEATRNRIRPGTSFPE